MDCLVCSSRLRWGKKAYFSAAEGRDFLHKAVTCISLVSDPLQRSKTDIPIDPLITNLAKHYLNIPATSVPKKWVFSTAGDTVAANRSALSADNVDKLIFLGERSCGC